MLDRHASTDPAAGEAAGEPAMARPDGLHFEEAGYRRLGAAAASALQNFCAPPVAGSIAS